MMNRRLLSVFFALLVTGCEPYTGAQTNCWSSGTSGASVSRSDCNFTDDFSFDNAVH